MPLLTRPLGYVVFAYWFLFWLMNGLDKFMHGATVSLGGAPVFTWFGKDRSAQFTQYFDRLDLPNEGIAPLLATCSMFELAVAALFAIAFFSRRRFEQRAGAAFAASALMFVGFSAWDVTAPSCWSTGPILASSSSRRRSSRLANSGPSKAMPGGRPAAPQHRK